MSKRKADYFTKFGELEAKLSHANDIIKLQGEVLKAKKTLLDHPEWCDCKEAKSSCEEHAVETVAEAKLFKLLSQKSICLSDT